MRVIVTAGGTGGHIYPALAIITKIKQMHPNSEFLYIGTHNRMEKDIIPQYGIPYKSIEIYGINRKNIFKNVKTVKCFIKSLKEIKKYIKDFKPDVVVGAGGYVTGPVIYMASKMGYKTFIHEQNSIPGRANKFLSKYADHIGVSFKGSIKYLPEYKTTFTGNPCGEEALVRENISKEKYGLTKTKPLVLFVMGSLGSSKMNDFLVKLMSLFEGKDYEVLFVTGKPYYEEVKSKTFPKNVKVEPYIDNMPGLMRHTTLMISRAGASTLSEIIALMVPSILIPSPYVTDNHQFKNASDLGKEGAAIIIEEKDLKEEILVEKIDELLENHALRENMQQQLKKFQVENSACEIVHILETLVR